MPQKARLEKVTYANQTMAPHGEKLWTDFPEVVGLRLQDQCALGSTLGTVILQETGKGFQDLADLLVIGFKENPIF